MNTFGSHVSDDTARAAGDALRELGLTPGSDPVAQLRHEAGALFARSADALADAAARLSDGTTEARTALERLDLAYRQLLTALAPLIEIAPGALFTQDTRTPHASVPSIVDLCRPPAQTDRAVPFLRLVAGQDHPQEQEAAHFLGCDR